MTQPLNAAFTVEETHHGLRLDQFLAQVMPDYSRGKIQQWIKAGGATLNHQTAKSKDKVKTGDVVHLQADTTAPHMDLAAQAHDLNIIYQDDHLWVLHKAIGMVVHPGAGNPDHTLANALLHLDPGLAALPRAGIVHRLDKDTSGLMVVARTPMAHQSLVQQLEARTVKRTYLALVNGTMITGGTVDAPIGRHPTARTKMAINMQGKTAITHYRIETRYRAHTLLRVNLETGRTHQIRVHMSSIRHPIVGDKTYGARPHLPKQCDPALRALLTSYQHQALHACELSLTHPDTQTTVQWSAEPPEDMQQLMRALAEDAAAHPDAANLA